MATPLPKYRVNASTFSDVFGDLTQSTAETRYLKKAGGGVTGALTVPTPSAPSHAATKAYADARIPVGVMMPYTATSGADPAGWLICYPGTREVSRTTYSALYSVIGTTYGAGNGSSTFGLPCIQARAPVGLDGGDGNWYYLGQMSGEPEHTLSAAEAVGQTPTFIEFHNAGGPTIMQSAGGAAWTTMGSGSYYHSHENPVGGAPSYSTMNVQWGGGGAHQNSQPYMALYYIIKY